MNENTSDTFSNTYKVSKLKVTSASSEDGDDISIPEVIRVPGETFAVVYLNKYLFDLLKIIIEKERIDIIYIVSESCIGFFNCFHGSMVVNTIDRVFTKELVRRSHVKRERICILCDLTVWESARNPMNPYGDVIDAIEEMDIIVTVSSLRGFASGANNIRKIFKEQNISLDMILQISGPKLILDRLPDYQEFDDFKEFIYFTMGRKGAGVGKEYVKEVNLFHDKVDYPNQNEVGGLTLTEGQFLESVEYMGRVNWYSKKKIITVAAQFSGVQRYKLYDLISGVNVNGKIIDPSSYRLVNLWVGGGIKLIGSALYFSSVWIDKSLLEQGQALFPQSSAAHLDLGKNLILPEFLHEFLSSSVGNIIRTARFASEYVSLDDYLEMEIYCPPITDQKAAIGGYKEYVKLSHNLRRAYFNIEFGAFLDLKSRLEIEKRIQSVSLAVGSLGDFSRIKNSISSGESECLEFKQTFGLDIKSNKKEKYIEDSAIKTIAAFLNSTGGNLLCGVSDNGQITGLNNEISIHYKSSDAFLLHVKNVVKQRIGGEFYPFVNFKLFDFDGQFVLEFLCSSSSTPVFVDEKDFYVRTNPATDKLEGRKQFEYIAHRFKK